MTSKRLLTKLLDCLEQTDSLDTPSIPASRSTSSNLLQPSQEPVRNVLLTLHFLFPHELLPALDLVDRKLITRLHLSPSLSDKVKPSIEPETNESEIFYVQSASAMPSSTASTGTSRFRNVYSKTNRFYEVRLDGWNCGCPAFAYSALKLLMRQGHSPSTNEFGSSELFAVGNLDQLPQAARSKGSSSGHRGFTYSIGGLTTKDDAVLPICKHLLAAVLVKAAPALFKRGVTNREADKVEIAGWAAGWGEQ